jgi:hypothetical protein
MDPQPSVVVNGDQKIVTLPVGASPAFYRLRQ